MRGAPRRYVRGARALNAVAYLKSKYSNPEHAITCLKGSYAEAKHIVCSWPQWGACAAFKLCDMAERVCAQHIDFNDVNITNLCTNKQVQAGVDKACRTAYCAPATLMMKMNAYQWSTRAGPTYDRRLNAQEFETILCYYSHDFAHSKHMPGMDALNVYKELQGFGELSTRIRAALPREGGLL